MCVQGGGIMKYPQKCMFCESRKARVGLDSSNPPSKQPPCKQRPASVGLASANPPATTRHTADKISTEPAIKAVKLRPDAEPPMKRAPSTFIPPTTVVKDAPVVVKQVPSAVEAPPGLVKPPPKGIDDNPSQSSGTKRGCDHSVDLDVYDADIANPKQAKHDSAHQTSACISQLPGSEYSHVEGYSSTLTTNARCLTPALKRKRSGCSRTNAFAHTDLRFATSRL